MKNPTVAVTHTDPSGRIKVMKRFYTVRQAEAFIATIEELDPAGVHSGEYGIDAPESFTSANLK